MDRKNGNGSRGRDDALLSWQRNAEQTLLRTERNLSSRPRATGNIIRAVTPEAEHNLEEEEDDEEEDEDGAAGLTRSLTPVKMSAYDLAEQQTSPRSIIGGEKPRERRQGLVFQDTFDANGSSTSQPTSDKSFSANSSKVPSTSGRLRTRTLEDTRRTQQPAPIVSRSRHRIGSVHSTNSTAYRDIDNSSGVYDGSSPVSFSPAVSSRSVQLQKSTSIKNSSGRRLVKKSASRPASPLLAQIPAVDSLPFPVATSDANKVLRLMKSLGGRMRGGIEWQTGREGPWSSGLCSIDDIKGNLVCEGEDRGPFYQIIVPDLRGCRVRPTMSLDRMEKCLEIISSASLKVRILPNISTEYDHWLAALLGWQQVRPGNNQIHLLVPEAPESRPAGLSRATSARSLREGNIIKVGKLLLWDRGNPPSSTVPSGRNPARPQPSSHQSWRKVSCILQDNGEFKLLTENDITVLSIIHLSQLSRCAIQQLDRSVLDEEFCIAIFPQYTSTSTAISIINPVYMALESRVLFEVWVVLLRAFTIPELYGSPGSNRSGEPSEEDQPIAEYDSSPDMFRIERSLAVRVVEAKLRKSSNTDGTASGKGNKLELDTVTGNYFAEVLIDREVRARTVTKFTTKTPFWREDCEFKDFPSTLPELSVILKRRFSEAASHSHRSANNAQSSDGDQVVICGVVDLRLDHLEKNQDSENWWPIKDECEEPVGEMLLKIRHEELAVLLSKEYQPISELLHKFSNGLTIKISEVVPSKLRYLSELFMNIFQVSGEATAWLTTLVEDEIDGIGKETPVMRLRFSRRMGSNDSFDSASERELSVRDMSKSLTGEANLLFRGNSLLTQSLDFHMRRLGKEYLEEVLREKIMEINAMDPNCEVDPSRLSHGDDVQRNWSQLNALTISVWDCIAESASRCPPALRQILKFIRAVADDRYGDFLRTVTYTSVSGFLFLRFFCPAILNPKLFDLLPDHPRAKAQRTLTLIAKSLQVLANMSNFGQKEAWMEPMNRFLSSHRQGLKEFLDEICSIPVERTTSALPASYSTPITILGRLPATSREGFPSLPYLIDHARNFAALIKFWLESTTSIVDKSSMDGDLLRFHNLCVSLQRRTDECLFKAEQEDLEFDGLSASLQLDEITSDLDRVDIPDGLELSANGHYSQHDLGLPAIINTPSRELQATPVPLFTSKTPPGSAGSNEIEPNSVQEKKSFWGAAFKDKNKHTRPQSGTYNDDLSMHSSTARTAPLPVLEDFYNDDISLHATIPKTAPLRDTNSRAERSGSTYSTSGTGPSTTGGSQRGFLGLATLRKKEKEKEKEKEAKKGETKKIAKDKAKDTEKKKVKAKEKKEKRDHEKKKEAPQSSASSTTTGHSTRSDTEGNYLAAGSWNGASMI